MPLSSLGKRRLAARNGDIGALSVDSLLNIFGQAYNPLDPSVAVNLSSVVRVLREPTEARRQQLKADHEAAAALCLKLELSGCKELRHTQWAAWHRKGLSAADLTTLATLGMVLPALWSLRFMKSESSAGSDDDDDEDEDGDEDEGVQRLAEGLGAGALPAVITLRLEWMHVAVTWLNVDMPVGDAGASALAASLGRGALPRLHDLLLPIAAIGDAGLVTLAPALRRLPALEELNLNDNPFGDKGLAALVAPPPPAVAPSPPNGVPNGVLMVLSLHDTQVSDAGCAALRAALISGALPALDILGLRGIPASVAAKDAVRVAHYDQQMW